MEVKPEEPSTRRRHRWLTVVFWIILAYNLLSISAAVQTWVFLIEPSKPSAFVSRVIYYSTALGMVSLISFVSIIGLLRWKRWGFYGFVVSGCLWSAIGAYPSLFPGEVVLGLAVPVALYCLLRIGKQGNTWSQLDP